MPRLVGFRAPWEPRRKDAGAAARRLLWPLQDAWRWLFYRPRPDYVAHETLGPQWKKLDSNWRYLDSFFFLFGPPGHLAYNIWRPILFIVAVASLSELLGHVLHVHWSHDSEEFVTRSFTMASFVLSLLLSVRVNIAFNRWWTFRTAFGSAVYGVADLVRRAAGCVPDMAQVEELQRWGAVWAHCIYAFLGWLPELPPAIDELLSPAEAAALRGAAKQRHYALARLRTLLLQVTSGLSDTQAYALNSALDGAQAGAGACGGICCTATPLVLRWTCTGLVVLWLAVIAAFRISNPNWLSLPMTLLLCVCMLAVDELASQMENAPHLVSLEALLVDAMQDAASAVAEAEQHRAAVWGWPSSEKGGLGCSNGSFSRPAAAGAVAAAAPAAGDAAVLVLPGPDAV